MINVSNLTKIYEDKQKSLKALDNVSFVLPDKGLVFVVGKSGSGKSTLINMLGALDDATSGSIEVDGFDICKLNINKLNQYRNEYLGIIYQNYNLFPQESILENIKIASENCNYKIDDAEIEKLLSDLDLNTGKNKLVKNLSGGQRQRVAIARALIKNPKLVLADEPTGNLDSRTSKNIFDLLLKISKERLVVVITHDLKNAFNYADRIIEIADGKISRDLVRNPNLKGKTIQYLQLDEKQSINDEEIKLINKDIASKKYKVIRKEELFCDFESFEETSDNNLEFSSKQQFKNIFKTSWKLLKSNKLSVIMTSLITMLIIGLLSISTAFTKFDGKAAINDVLDIYDVKNLVIRKSYSKTGRSTDLEKNDMLKINDEEEYYINDVGYVGHKYPLYTGDFPISGDAWPVSSLSTHGIKFESFYSDALSGVVQCDEAYLHHLFGDYEVLAGSIYDNENSGKIIVPDYIADSILFFRNTYRSSDPDDPYQEIVNKKLFSRMIIGAVIKTNYKEKYATLLETVNRIKREPTNASQLKKAIIGSPSYSEFLNDANSYLNYGYSFCQDYVASQSKINLTGYFNRGYFTREEKGPECILSSDTYDCYVIKELTENNVSMSVTFYNEMFGKNIDKPTSTDFQEKDFYFYKYSNEKVINPVVEKVYRFHITKLHTATGAHDFVRVSPEMYEDIVNWVVFQYGWVFDDAQQCYDIYTKVAPYGFYNCVTCFEAVYNTINIISIFSDVFNILLFVFIGILVLIVVMHNRRIIKKEQYRFGVYKSLGYSNLYLTLGVILIDLLTSIVIFAISLLFSWGIGEIANFLIQFGFYKWSQNVIYYSIRMLSFSVLYVGLASLLVLVIMVVSSFIPLLAIRKIKPSKIIRNAE